MLGLATYNKEDSSCEIVTIDALIKGKGIGSKLLEMLEKIAERSGCSRIWMITTNDNPEAASFYIKRGYRLVKVRLNALEKSRKLKPQIPKVGNYGIPLLDEWIFEKRFWKKLEKASQ